MTEVMEHQKPRPTAMSHEVLHASWQLCYIEWMILWLQKQTWSTSNIVRTYIPPETRLNQLRAWLYQILSKRKLSELQYLIMVSTNN